MRGEWIRVSVPMLPRMLEEWSEPVQVKVESNEDGELELIFRSVKPTILGMPIEVDERVPRDWNGGMIVIPPTIDPDAFMDAAFGPRKPDAGS